MKWSIATFLFATLILPVWPTAASADPDSCRQALDQFDKAQNALATIITPYSNCIAYSNGHQRCADQFAALQNAQSQYQAAVADYERNCTN